MPPRRRSAGAGASPRRQLDWPPPGGNLRRPPSVAAIDGSKLDIDFEKAGRKKVLDSFIQPT
jgi:hypothetical protein